MTHSVPPLPYPTDALEPHIDKQTMETHHDGHHAAYVKKLNAALEKYPQLQDKNVDELLRNLQTVPDDIRKAVRNNGGGHSNHTLFWQIMGPRAGGEATGDIATALTSSFGSFQTFKEQFSNAALNHFGSGWAWVVQQGDRLAIETLPNQDSPLLEGKMPIFGLDVWEHAYYLKYRNKRDEYINAWWNVVNWSAVNKQLASARGGAVGASR